MHSDTWKNQMWIHSPTYPKGTKLSSTIFVICFIIIIFLIVVPKYPIYQDYYGIIENDNVPIIKVPVSILDIEDFEKAIIEDKQKKLVKIDSNIEVEGNRSFIFVYIEVNVTNGLLLKNNIIPIKLKMKEVNLFEELYQKFVKGMKK